MGDGDRNEAVGVLGTVANLTAAVVAPTINLVIHSDGAGVGLTGGDLLDGEAGHGALVDCGWGGTGGRGRRSGIVADLAVRVQPPTVNLIVHGDGADVRCADSNLLDCKTGHVALADCGWNKNVSSPTVDMVVHSDSAGAIIAYYDLFPKCCPHEASAGDSDCGATGDGAGARGDTGDGEVASSFGVAETFEQEEGGGDGGDHKEEDGVGYDRKGSQSGDTELIHKVVFSLA